jgi:hypothetical protein
MATATRRTTPKTAKVSLDLDKLDREGGETDLYTVRLKGKVFTLAGPSDMPYFDIAGLQRNEAGERQFLTKLLGDQLDDFMACNPSVEQVMHIFEDWREHYELPSPGEAPASPT